MLQIVHDWFLDAPFNIFQLYQGTANFLNDDSITSTKL